MCVINGIPFFVVELSNHVLMKLGIMESLVKVKYVLLGTHQGLGIFVSSQFTHFFFAKEVGRDKVGLVIV
jgi:hypothetical protein